MTFAAAIIPMMYLNSSDNAIENPNCNPNGYCLGETDFCTSRYPCREDQGDCDYDNECNSGLICGNNNCPSQLEFDSTVDCCIPQSSTTSTTAAAAATTTIPQLGKLLENHTVL